MSKKICQLDILEKFNNSQNCQEVTQHEINVNKNSENSSNLNHYMINFQRVNDKKNDISNNNLNPKLKQPYKFILFEKKIDKNNI